jgi:hypothetical protein
MHTNYPDADPQRACTRKKAYPDEKLAKRVARSINERDTTANVRAYGCTLCGSFHIGSAPR